MKRKSTRMAALVACMLALSAPAAAHAQTGMSYAERIMANRAGVQQTGRGNAASIAQNGQGNTAGMRQFGDNNSGAIQQNGSNNTACLVQIGRGLDASIAQTGNYNSVGVLQTQRGVRQTSPHICNSRRGTAYSTLIEALRAAR